MNKSDLVTALAEKLRMSKKEATIVVEAIFGGNGGIIVTALSKDDQVALSGFGVFELKQRPTHSARNPKTGRTVIVPEKSVPVFRPAKALKEKLSRPSRKGR